MKILTLAVILAMFAFPVIAQQQCGPTQGVYVQLTVVYGEVVTEERVIANNGQDILLQFWLNADTGTWTITGTGGGATCLLAAGDKYDGENLDEFLAYINGEQDT